MPDQFLGLQRSQSQGIKMMRGCITLQTNNLVIPGKGCAVICHGLVSASHLNGELGEVRDVKPDGTGIRMGVHFEKKGVKSALVKPENLLIAFELPNNDKLKI